MTAAGRCIFYFYNMRIDRPESEKILTLACCIWRKKMNKIGILTTVARIPSPIGDGMNCTFEHVCLNEKVNSTF